MSGPLSACVGGTRAVFHVLPRAKRTELVGRHGDALKLRVQAPPVDGAANDAIVAFLAELLAIPRDQVVILTGHAGRRKVIDLLGVPPERAASVLTAP